MTADKHSPLTLAQHAAISAELVEGLSLPEVLKAHEITVEDWNRETIRVTGELAADVRAHGIAAASPQVYAAAFAEAQERLRSVPELTVEQWVALEHQLETRDAAQVLAEHGLRFADRLRLSRHWSGRLAREEGLARRYREIVNAMRSS